MKNNNLFILFALSLSLFLFTSCDSLWSVGETTNISFNLNLEKYFSSNSNNNTRSVGVVPGGGAFVDLIDNPDVYVLVSLHNSSDDSVIASQKLSLKEAQNTSAAFDEIRMRTELYAKIEVNNPYDVGSDIPFVFRARTHDVTVRGKKVELVAKPNAVFYEENGVSYVNGDSSYPIDGPNYEIDNLGWGNPVIRPNASVLRDIYEFMKVDGSLLPDATVYIIDTMKISEGNEIWDFDGLTIMRASSGNAIVSVTNDASLTLNSVIIDGNRDIFEANNAAITVESNADLIINDGSVVKNNSVKNDFSAIGVGGGIFLADGTSLVMNGGTVSNNTSRSGGGGVHVSDGASIMVGGNVTVKGNLKQYIANSNNIYLEGSAPSLIQIRQVLTCPEKSIGITLENGLSPMVDAVKIVEGNGYNETVNDSKRFFSDNTLYIVDYLQSEGICLYKPSDITPGG